MTTNETMAEVDRLLAKFDADLPEARAHIENAIRKAAADELRAMATRIEVKAND